jgi:phosphoserine phosphatase
MEKRKIALFDIDGTIYERYVIFPLAEYQLKERTINKNCLGELYKDLELYRTGKIDYETLAADLLTHWAKGLKGISYSTVLEQTKRFFKGEGNKFLPFLKRVITLLEKTHDIYFITGEPKFVAQTASGLYETTGFLSSELEVENSIFTGKVRRLLARRDEKEIVIKQLLEDHDLKRSFAFGNAEGDIEMLNSVELPICINPTPGLREIAIRKNWKTTNPENVEETISSLLADRF